MRTFVIYEESVRGQRVLVVGDVLEDISEVHVHSHNSKQKVSKVARAADCHNEAWGEIKEGKVFCIIVIK